jgi:hypothetical protein
VAQTQSSDQRPADVLVVFGITGDLAHAYDPGSWGPPEADRLTAAYGGWHSPWVAS